MSTMPLCTARLCLPVFLARVLLFGIQWISDWAHELWSKLHLYDITRAERVIPRDKRKHKAHHTPFCIAIYPDYSIVDGKTK